MINAFNDLFLLLLYQRINKAAFIVEQQNRLFMDYHLKVSLLRSLAVVSCFK